MKHDGFCRELKLVLGVAVVLACLSPSGWTKDIDEMGAARLQELLRSNPSMEPEAATLTAVKELRKKKASRRGAAQEGLKEIHRRTPANLKSASLRIMEADPQLAPWVLQTAGALDRSLNQDLLLAAIKAKPDCLGYAIQVACDNDATRYRELAMAAQAVAPGNELEILAGLMGSRCRISQAICWHFRELKKRKPIVLASVLDEAIGWEAEAKKGGPRNL